MSIWVGAAALCVASLVTAPLSAEAAFPGKNGHIAVEGDDQPGIWAYTSDGKNRDRLTKRGGCPAYSANGRMIAFVDNGALWKMRADGSHRNRLVKSVVDCTIDDAVSWSPDGRQIAFAKKDDIWRVSAKGHHARRVTRDGSNASDTAPAWSPSGRKIAFHTHEPVSGDNELRIVRARGHHPHVLVSQSQVGIYSPENPDWAPNGRRIVFDTSGSKILTVKPDGSGLQAQFSGSAGCCEDPVYSPDGQRLAFGAFTQGSQHDIITSDLSGKKRHQVTSKGLYWFAPSWQPR